MALLWHFTSALVIFLTFLLVKSLKNERSMYKRSSDLMCVDLINTRLKLVELYKNMCMYCKAFGPDRGGMIVEELRGISDTVLDIAKSINTGGKEDSIDDEIC